VIGLSQATALCYGGISLRNYSAVPAFNCPATAVAAALKRTRRRGMKALAKTILACAAALAMGASTASAAIVCNDEGDCWRVKERRDYKPELKLHVYDDDWKWKEGAKHRWRDPGHGHGYYRGGVWIGID
jgi:hypothetical protein